ncbi:MAG: hypothetical protein EXR66_09255 [Dehalococcoidia bacterium]|nr:hypothetical protein [Dehalococcoidia bacterium]
MAHALETHGSGAVPHCEACAAREAEAERAANAGILARSRAALGRWFNALNGTPVADISRGDMGSIRRLAEA